MDTQPKRDKINKMLADNSGKIYTVTFLKQDGSSRVMNCRDKVVQYLAGGESTIADKPHLHGTFDLQVEDYRCFNLDTVSNLKIAGMSVDFPKTGVL